MILEVLTVLWYWSQVAFFVAILTTPFWLGAVFDDAIMRSIDGHETARAEPSPRAYNRSTEKGAQ